MQIDLCTSKERSNKGCYLICFFKINFCKKITEKKCFSRSKIARYGRRKEKR